MPDIRSAQAALDAAMDEAERLRTVLKRGTGPQVRSSEERSVTKATALTWFGSHRDILTQVLGDAPVQALDDRYNAVLRATDRASARAKYDTLLKELKPLLSALRTEHLAAAAKRAGASRTETPPSFARLIPDPAMQAALARRWIECNRCLAAGAPLAATVVMGGLLEALLLARVNAEPNKGAVFGAKGAPKEKSTGKPMPLKEWMLRAYLDVAHELRWISQSAKDVGEVLRDYRNYIHPYKELAHGIVLTTDDAAVLWDVARSIAKQLVR